MSKLKDHWGYQNSLDLGTYPRNQELQFSLTDMDTEQRFNQDPPENWSRESFSYKYNSHGFRSREFIFEEGRPKILTFGCSHTLGVGIPFEDTWCEELGRKLPNHTVYNAGLGGATADTVARLVTQMVPIISPDIVAILWPSMYRFEIYSNGYDKTGTRFMGPWDSDSETRLQFEDNNSYNNFTKNKLIVSLMQKLHHFVYLSMDVDYVIEQYSGIKWPKARDNAHFGPEWHKEIGKEYFNEYIRQMSK